ncbi:MAG: mechanosensitive ion channel family protein [Pseudomonadales bacterium]|jgi:MscS family membrane protein|nr:mechanosensitive ion channel family protein [Pseudomonadales bacterium]MDP6471350.1 mechanosensitive ion channel family protein [Pseudomonadales bacterium]MDP6826459.1 mechanosensitive ion channel family protein [Pseudomonadales bacterium]MDP6970086.1 mechanosensitive ion channel family protein [Pseudomonadales bacterium]
MNDLITGWRETAGWEVEVFAIVFATGVVHLLARIMMRHLARQLEKTQAVYDDALVDSARKPLAFAIWIIGVSWAAEVAGRVNGGGGVFAYIDDLRNVSILLMMMWFALRFIKFVEIHISDQGYRNKPVDRTSVIAIGRLLRISIVITGTLMVLQALGFSVTGLLAFGGIGGAAVGFAAKDLLANFFGALMIFLDRPFSVGDWICSPDRDIEGTVEEIGWRLTRIRTFDQRPLYVPNSVFTTLAVENPSRMLNRRIYETIGIRYDDVHALPAIVADVENMLKEHAAIDQQKTLMVNFNAFGASSLDFFVYTFTRTTAWAEYHEIKQDVLFRISEIITDHSAEIAFPTQTLLLAEPEQDVPASDRPSA